MYRELRDQVSQIHIYPPFPFLTSADPPSFPLQGQYMHQIKTDALFNWETCKVRSASLAFSLRSVLNSLLLCRPLLVRPSSVSGSITR
jgi:hypothetical protein